MANNSEPVSVVTGAAGFLGSHLVDRLLNEGHRVIAIDNLITGKRVNVPRGGVTDVILDIK